MTEPRMTQPEALREALNAAANRAHEQGRRADMELFEDAIAALEAHGAETLTYRVIGYTHQYDLDFPLAYPSLGPLQGDRTIPVYVPASGVHAVSAPEPACRIYWNAHEGWKVEWLQQQPNGGQENYFYAALPPAASGLSADARSDNEGKR